ncbi:MAG: murein transglycosylase A [bacterium]|nr:murein transglycosylase A [bacterium]
MNKKKLIALALGLLLLAALVYFYFTLRVKEKIPVKWTPQNSLLSPTPNLTRNIDDTGNLENLLKALDYSLTYLKKLPPQKPFTFGPHTVPCSRIIQSIETFKTKLTELGLTESFFTYVKENFHFYKSAADSVLFTGYYEARLNGSLTQSPTFRHPLYKKPPDLVRIDLKQFPIYNKVEGLPGVLKGRLKGKRISPYFSRNEIDEQETLSGKDLELVWIDNAVDVFFLQIQGSGIVYLDTGEKMRVNYAESNGHPYRAIGRLMIDRGMLTRESVSMQTIRQYLENHPEEVTEIFNYNPSYVFFREVKKGPIGSLGVPVTAFRSIATDNRLFPRGALCYIETELPVFDEKLQVKEWKSFGTFVMNQDTGGAIRSPSRVDLFTGYGEASELTAGHMKQKGMLHFLLLKR